jgi:hypothetical protein
MLLGSADQSWPDDYFHDSLWRRMGLHLRGSAGPIGTKAMKPQHVDRNPTWSLLAKRRYLLWLISRRWPSGSRKNARISQSYSTGGVRNVAPRSRRIW